MNDEWTSQSAPTTAVEPTSAKESATGDWERELVNRLAFAALNEQRRARRWSIFFKSLLFVYLFALLFAYRPEGWESVAGKAGRHTALVEIDGIIAAEGNAGADQVITGLRAAFENSKTAGVIVRINSPGGSPVQAGYINDEMRRLRKAHPDIPLYAVVADICASGGYYIAVAADKIFVDKASIIGSIGVRMDSFGFVEALEKLGVERRLLTAGDHKGFLDPFLPSNPTDVAHVQTLLNDIHQQFIATVKNGRGDRLKPDESIFSGLVWTGEQGIELGLVDGLGSASYVAREVVGEENIVDFTAQPDFFERFAGGVGTALGDKLIGALSGTTLK